MKKGSNDDIFEVALKNALIELDNIRTNESEQIFKKYSKDSKQLSIRKISILKLHDINKMVACLLLIVSISFGIVFNVDAFKYELNNLIYNYYNTHTIITTESPSVRKILSEIDMSWKQIYFPENLPKGYSVSNIESNEDFCFIRLMNDKKEQLTYYLEKLYEESNIEIDIDIEDAEISYKTIDDKDVTFIKKYNKYHVYFFYDSIYFSIVSDNLIYQDLIKLIDSIDIVDISGRGD